MMKHRILKTTACLLRKYPESSLIDIYKSFFQDEYGPGHLLEDGDKPRQYFFQELSVMTSRGRHTLEPCGTGCRFFRAPMDTVLDGLISPEEFYEGFIEGASGFSLPDLRQWVIRWEEILSVIQPLIDRIPDKRDDEKKISEALQSGRAVMHHSTGYVKAYDPHYRIARVNGALYRKLR